MTYSLRSWRCSTVTLFTALVFLAACGGPEEGDPARARRKDGARKRPSPAASVDPATPVPEPTTPVAVGDCSAAGMEAPSAPDGLSEDAAGMWQAVVNAAVACDYDELARLGLAGEGHFQFTYGDGTDPAAYWREIERHGEEVLAPLVTIMGLPFVEDEFGTGPKGRQTVRSYSWPSAHQAEPSDADWQALVDAALYTQKQIDQMRAAGSGYLGWRAGITAAGDWIFFIAGD